MRKIHIAMLFVIAVSFGVGAYLYPQLPERVASHWNAQGDADSSFSKLWGILLVPLISVALFLLALFLPHLEPMKESVEKNRKNVEGLFLVLILFFSYIHALTLAWAVGHRFNMTTAIIPGISLLFFYLGSILKQTEQNWLVGIRTPWTLSNKTVWKKTHMLGGTCFQVSGIISLLGIFFPMYAIFFMLGPVIFSAIVSTIYSYVIFKKEKISSSPQ